MGRVLRRRLLSTDHHPYQRVPRYLLGRHGCDQLAVAQDGDAVGDVERLLERMRDEDDARSLLLQRIEKVKQMLRLFGG